MDDPGCVSVEKSADAITITIPRRYLIECAIPAAFEGVSGFEDVRVCDEDAVVHDIATELKRELGEDGTTLVHTILDSAFQNAFENGSEGFQEGRDD